MKFIQDQIEAAVSGITVEKPIIKLKMGYSNSINLDLNNKVSFNETVASTIDKMVMDVVRQRVSVKLNIDSKMYKVNVDHSCIVQSVLYSIEHIVTNFLRNYGGFTNNRLSKIYKWYKEKVGEASMRKNEKLAQDLYNVVKFWNGSNQGEDAQKTVRTLLTLVKNRYEPTLGSV